MKNTYLVFKVLVWVLFSNLDLNGGGSFVLVVCLKVSINFIFLSQISRNGYWRQPLLFADWAQEWRLD